MHTRILIALLMLFLMQTGAVSATEATDEEPKFTRTQVEEDLEQLYRSITRAAYDVHARTSKTSMYLAYNRARVAVEDEMSLEAVSRLFVTFVAHADIAHLRVEWPAFMHQAFQGDKVKLIPFRYRIVNGESWVTGNQSGHSALLPGRQITAINGQSMTTFNESMRKLVAADSPYLENAIIEMQLPWLIWLAHGDMTSLTVTVQRPDGQSQQITINGLTRDEYSSAAESAGTSNQLQLDWMARSYKRINGAMGYIRPGPFFEPEAEYAYDNEAFTAFINEAFDHMLRHRVDSIIIDLRNNPGGDSSFSDLMVAWFADRTFRFNADFSIRVSEETTASNRARLQQSGGDESSISAQFDRAFSQLKNGDVYNHDLPYSEPRKDRRFDGKVYVLINRHSYSNATNVAALVQDHGFGTLIGEETADLASTHGAMETFKLRHTDLTVGYPKALITRPNGNTAARGVIPDHPIETPIIESLNDPVLHAAIDWVKLDMKATSAIVSSKSEQ